MTVALTEITVTTVGTNPYARDAATFMSGAEEQGYHAETPLTVVGIPNDVYTEPVDGTRYALVAIIRTNDEDYVLGITDPYAPADTDPTTYEHKLRIIRPVTNDDIPRFTSVG